MVTKIVVKLELGHVAKTLNVTTATGHTHEWMVFVKGADEMNIQHFVEKVVFWLHESYEPPKCVVKNPPYQVKQSGYAGFNILIDIHFKNKSEPKSVRFRYDLFLHKENMPPVNHTRIEMLTFTNPADDFRKRLLKGGGILRTQDTQSKEKKSHKDIRHSEDKVRVSTKEKNETEKVPIKHRPEAKLVKFVKKERHGSIDDAEQSKKKRQQKRSSTSPTSPSNDSKIKEKLSKPKVKMDNSVMSGLFSIDEIINIKQLKRKETAKNEAKREKIKRKDYSDKKKKKMTQVQSPASSSSSEPRKKASFLSTSSDSDDADIIDKQSGHSAFEQKKGKKNFSEFSSNLTQKSVPSKKKYEDERFETKKIKVSSSKSSKLFHQSSEQSKDEKLEQSLPEKSRSHAKSKPKDVPKELTSRSKKENQTVSHRTCDRTVVESMVWKNKTIPDSIESKHAASSSSSGLSSDENLSPMEASQTVSPLSSCSVDQGEIFLDVLDNRKDVEGAFKSHSQAEASESEQDLTGENYQDVVESGDVFANDDNSTEEEEEDKKETASVVVGKGETLQYYPHMSVDLFDQLQTLQTHLATVTDSACLSKIVSVVRKSGNFSLDGDMVHVDLCALDRKTIHKIHKYLARK